MVGGSSNNIQYVCTFQSMVSFMLDWHVSYGLKKEIKPETLMHCRKGVAGVMRKKRLYL